MPDFDIVSYLMGKTSGGGGGMTSKSISGTGTTAVIGSGWTKTDITNAASAVVSVTVFDTTIHLIYSEDIYYYQNGKYMFYFGTVNDALESFECGILFDPTTQTFELSEFQYAFETEETSFYSWADITTEIGDWTLTVIGVGGGGGGGGTIVSKTITANGTYNASADDADGYSPVVVNVSGGGQTKLEEVWDFTSETPLVGAKHGIAATQTSVTFGASGAVFDSAYDRIVVPCPEFAKAQIGIIVNVSQMQLPSSTDHQRFIMAGSSGYGLIYRNMGDGKEWGMYSVGVWTMSGITDGSAFDGSTVKVVIDENGKWKIYKNGTLWWDTNVVLRPTGNFRIGETEGKSIRSATIAGASVSLSFDS